MDNTYRDAHIGNLSQIFDLKTYRLEGAKSDNMLISEISDKDITFTVSASRCMDISSLKYKGINVCFISPVGNVAPQYYSPNGIEWLRSFTAGMFTTCGLSNAGSPCNVNGEEYGLHGRIANTPADCYNAYITNDDGKLTANFVGKMKEARLFGDNLSLERKIKYEYCSSKVEIEDTVTNEGFSDAVHMQVYHMNFGFPFLDESCIIYTNEIKCQARNEHAAKGFDGRKKGEAPIVNFEEMCFYYDLAKDSDGFSSVIIYNHNLDMGALLRFSHDTLDHFIQWKSLCSGYYVMGLEPANAWVEGREKAIADNDYKVLAPGQSVKQKLSLEFFSGKNELKKYKAEYSLK